MQLYAVRLHDGDNVKEAIEAFVSDQELSSATVISAVGSLQNVRMRMSGAQPDRQDIRDLNGPFEIVSLIGNLGPGRTHLHIAVSDSEGRVLGGHLKEGSKVHTTVELVVATQPDLEFSEEADPDTGFGELKITQND
jgi:predicted DNA-binding protein with PD1-like motif